MSSVPSGFFAVFPDTSINIWGQRTLQSQPSALDRVNVRRLMMYMEQAIAESLIMTRRVLLQDSPSLGMGLVGS